jgi:hypothetical protein
MGAIVNALAGTDGDTGVVPAELLPLITFWEQTRGLYRPFESDMRSPSTDVYLHEMPGEREACPRTLSHLFRNLLVIPQIHAASESVCVSTRCLKFTF